MWCATRLYFGPHTFFIVYAPVGRQFCVFDIAFHCYADDLHVYLLLMNGNSLENLMSCLSGLKTWLASNFEINENKTECSVWPQRS